MGEIDSKSVLLKSRCKYPDQPYSTNSCNEDDNDHDWWASDSGSSTGSYYSDTDSSVVEWESEIGPSGEVFYVESAVESLFEDFTIFDSKSDNPQPELTRRRSTRAGKLFRLIRRKESKRWSTRNKKINSSTVACNIVPQEKDATGSKEVTFRDFQAGEIRDVTLWIDPERRHKLGRRATLCEAYFGITPARGAFITLNHLLPSITGPQPVSTTVYIGEEKMHIVYTSHDDELLLIALPERWCTVQEAVKITEDVVRMLEFTYQSLTKCFTTSENQSSLDHLFILIMHRLINIKDSSNDIEAKKHMVEPQNTVENTENYKFRSAFSVANFIQLPRDAQIQIDAALSEMEAMDYRDWNEDPMDCQRLYTILGSCVYHKCYLLGSHLPHEDLIDVHSFLRHNGLLNLMNQEQIKCLVLWKQIYPSSCNRGNVSGNDNDQLLIPDGKWFLLVVAYGHDLLAVLLESGGCTAKYNDAIGPDVFYVEEAQETLKHIQKIGVTTLASKWIMSNTRPEVIPYEEHIMTKSSSSITENLFSLIKSSDAQTAISKQNFNPATNKKPQELPSILKKRSPEESPMISGSVYSLQTSEDSLSQGTGGISEMSDEAMPILGRRATREKINSTSRYSDDSDSDIDIYKNDSHVLALDISNIRENLLNQAEYLIPKKLTTGDKNYLYHYVHLDMVEGILLSSIPIQNMSKDNKILANFNKCVHAIHRLLHNTVRFKMLNQDMDKTVINRSLIAVKEHGVLFEWENTAFWVIGRLYTSPHPKELYICYQDSAPQNLIEIAFQLHK
ncbi:PDZ domain-containing protein 6 [Harpegnathos saltator]|uniref:PDZ domain-containing protein 6 n=1 Tax=Harpegnathos saltator TaxID=610380 RepID=E2BN96_HARSA|nr:PDZ domain-containing protein 6 [Harpegnathos saltator]